MRSVSGVPLAGPSLGEILQNAIDAHNARTNKETKNMALLLTITPVGDSSKITIIKAIRAFTSMSLKDAKDAFEQGAIVDQDNLTYFLSTLEAAVKSEDHIRRQNGYTYVDTTYTVQVSVYIEKSMPVRVTFNNR